MTIKKQTRASLTKKAARNGHSDRICSNTTTGVKNGTAENSEGKKCHIVKQPPEYHIADINFSGMT